KIQPLIPSGFCLNLMFSRSGFEKPHFFDLYHQKTSFFNAKSILKLRAMPYFDVSLHENIA
ncbi:MAG: hypothetical protein II834_11170, partial [Bacteroidaceae bacterium]|nr:hypothetical protein [Bacteroidaceae bacterium]